MHDVTDFSLRCYHSCFCRLKSACRAHLFIVTPSLQNWHWAGTWSYSDRTSFFLWSASCVCLYEILPGSASEVRCSVFTVEQLESLALVQVLLLMDYPVFVREKDGL